MYNDKARNTYLEIEKAKATDMPYIKEKLQKYLLDATNIDCRQFFVGKNGGRSVAFGRIIDHGEFLEIASLGVDYYHRGKGFGTKMMEFLIKEAIKMDSRKPVYGVTHKLEFFRKVGFEEVKAYPEYMDYKKYSICKNPSVIKIIKYNPEKVSIV